MTRRFAYVILGMGVALLLENVVTYGAVELTGLLGHEWYGLLI